MGQLVSKTIQTFSSGSTGERIEETKRFFGPGEEDYYASYQAFYSFDDQTAVSAGRIAWKIQEDGTASHYAYQAGQDGWHTVTVTSGVIANPQATSISSVTDIDASTQTTTDYNEFWTAVMEMKVDVDSGQETGLWVSTGQDLYGRSTGTKHFGNPNDIETFVYDCCGIAERTDRQGVWTKTTYDALRRVLQTQQRPYAYGPGMTNGREIITTNIITGLTTEIRKSDGTSNSDMLSSKSGSSINRLTRTTLSPDADGDPATIQETEAITVYHDHNYHISGSNDHPINKLFRR